MTATANTTQDKIGGYNVELIDNINVKHISCNICRLILREPLQAVKCGHRFCKNCIEDFHKLKPRHLQTCPVDGQQIKVFPDVGRKREIEDLRVKCTNAQCEQEGPIKCLQDHLNECPWQLVECSSRCGENEIPRKKMRQHLATECFKPLPCKYSVIGCEFQGKKEKLIEHLSHSSDFHSTLQMERFLEMKKKMEHKDIEIRALRERVANMSRSIAALPMQNRAVWRIEKFREEKEHSKAEGRTKFSKPFFCLNGYKARLALNIHDLEIANHMSVILQLMTGPFDDALVWPMPFNLITFELKINGKIVQTLKHHKKDASQFSRPMHERGVAGRKKHFFANENIPNQIENNLVLIIVEVTPLEKSIVL